MVGIYKITNMINGQEYVGQSRNIHKRWLAHLNSAFNNNDHSYNTPLYRAIRKYGLENFDFKVLEECSVTELNQKEEKWISKLDTFFNGYNLTLGGDSSGGGVPKENILGVFHDLETTDLLHREIAKKWKISTEMVQGINTGRYWHQDRDYPIQERTKRRHQKIITTCVDCGKEISVGATRCVPCENKHRVRITDKITRDELKDLIRTTSFVQIGKKYGVTDNAVRKWCDRYNLPHKKGDIKKYNDKEWAEL